MTGLDGKTRRRRFVNRRTTPAQELLLELPDRVARQAELGCPVVVDDPGSDHGRRLLLSLGVTIRRRRP